MLNECLEGLQIRPDGIYVDVTFGGGGHSRAILEHLTNPTPASKPHLYSFDQDIEAFNDSQLTIHNSQSREPDAQQPTCWPRPMIRN